MPTKTWAVGEEVLAADFNTYVQKQVVSTFADAAARAAALTTPTTGQLTMLANPNGRLDFWNGAGWIEVVPKIQRGLTTITTNSGGGATTTFPITFGAGPVYAIGQDYASAAGGIIIVGVLSSGITTSAVSWVCRRTDLANTPPAASIVVNIGWIAMGAWP